MAFAGLRTREVKYTGTTDITVGVYGPGVVVALVGARVTTAASAGTMVVTYDGVTLIADAQLLPQATGLKRPASTQFILGTGTTNTLLLDGTGITGTPEITFYFLMYKAEPGPGEV